MNKHLKIKICGTREPANIQAIIQLPIDYIGFIFYSKSARYVNQFIATNVPEHIKKVGVFVNSTLEEIKEKVEQFSLQSVQLHGDESPEFCKQVQSLGVETIKAFGIDDNFNWRTIAAYEPVVDVFLFDTKSDQYGGTGQSFNWDKLQENPYQKPFLLSGGISLDNIHEAANFNDERLLGLDLNSKFETSPALKNINLLTQALSIINNEQISSR